MHLIKKVNVDKDDKDLSLNQSVLASLRQVGKDVAETVAAIERLKDRLHRLQGAADLIAGRKLANVRPWKLVKERVVELQRPITWEEAKEVAICASSLFANPNPISALRRSISLADELKVVNDRIGLTEWPEEMYGTQE